MTKHKLYDVWNQVPVDYYQKGVRGNLLQGFWHGKKIDLAKAIIKNLDFKNCLDVGCASGYMLSEIGRFFPGAKYYGVDVFDKAINFARKVYPGIRFRVASAEDLPFKAGSFDLVICYETIEHVEDPKATLLEIKRVLRRNGTCILTMDSGNWLFRIVWFFWENGQGSVWKGAHLHPFHHTQLESMIKNSGLKIKRKIFSHFGMEVTFVLTK